MTRVFLVLLLLGTVAHLPGHTGPRVVTPTGQPSSAARRPSNPATYQRISYPWHKNITATVFWVGERPNGRNKTSNHHSSWDGEWQKNFGGFDNPDRAARSGYVPKGFTPRLNPFYIALPYNDVLNHRAHRPEAARVVPWFKRCNPKPGTSTCHGRWIQIYHNGKSCFAQWEDCGPFTTDDWQYVFGNRRPRNRENGAAGLDVSPAVRDFLGLPSSGKVHWRFVAIGQVPRGPWSSLGTNNPFVNAKANPDLHAAQRYNEYLRKLRDQAYQKKDVGRSNLLTVEPRAFVPSHRDAP